jgi:Ca2+-binding EF-hand superfamily protein
VVALLKGFKSIIYIGIILLLVFYMFAILGMILFEKNDPWHFGTLHLAMLTLFRASTLEDWTDIMYINMYGCMNYGYNYEEGVENVMGCTKENSEGWGVVSALFFFVFIILGALVLLTLFIGVVTTSMEEATEEMKSEQAVIKQVELIKAQRNVDSATIELYRTVFNMLDLDGGGSIGEDELCMGLESVGKQPNDDELREMLAKVDEDNTGEIDFAEFVTFMCNLQDEEKGKIASQNAVNSADVTSGEDALETDDGGSKTLPKSAQKYKAKAPEEIEEATPDKASANSAKIIPI